MINILAIETSTDACSVALLHKNKIYDRFEISPQKHSKLIIPMIDDVLNEAKLDLNQLSAIAFGCGPGSFTGIRLAASATQGIAFAKNIPVIKISTLHALAQEVFEEFQETEIVIAQDARMNEIYFGEYCLSKKNIINKSCDKLISPANIKITFGDNYVGAGNGWKIYSDILLKNCNMHVIDSKIYPQAKYVVKLARESFIRGAIVSANYATPVYLREKIAWTCNDCKKN